MKPNKPKRKILLITFSVIIFSFFGCVMPIPITYCGSNLRTGLNVETTRDLFLLHDNDNNNCDLPTWSLALPEDEVRAIGFRHPKLGQRIRIHHVPEGFQEYNATNHQNHSTKDRTVAVLPQKTKIRIVGPQKDFVGLGYEMALVGIIENGQYAGIPVDIQDITWNKIDLYFPLFPVVLTSCYSLDDQILCPLP